MIGIEPNTELEGFFFLALTCAIAATFVFYLLTWLLKERSQLGSPRIFRKADVFSPNHIPSKIDTIVIGSGIGASTCASSLAQSGQRVLVLEKHFRTGGCTHSFRSQDKTVEFDTGLHYVPKDMSDKTSRSGALMSFLSMGAQKFEAFPEDEPYDEVHIRKKLDQSNVSIYPFFSGKRRMVNEIIDLIDPQNTELKERVITFVNLCSDINSCFTALGLSRLLPKFLGFLTRDKVNRLMKLASMTVRDVQYAILNLGYTEDMLLDSGCPKAPEGPERDTLLKKVKGVLCHPIGDYAVQPREASIAAHGVTMSHYIDGAAYTKGPTQHISVHLASVVRSFGGEVLVDACVHNIITENGKAVGVVVCNNSAAQKNQDATTYTTIRAKNIVCGTSVFNLYTKLLSKNLPIVQKFLNTTERTIQPSNGHIFLFCNIRGDPEDLKLPRHNIWYFNDYDLDGAFDRYFENPTDIRPPTVYIGFQCAKDVTWRDRFPGQSNCILISDGLYEWFEKWKDKPARNRGDEYKAFKEKLSNHLLDILYEQVPYVKGKVASYELGTPLTEETYLSSYHGGSYGTKCTTDMFSLINRNWTTNSRTEVPNLFLAGSDAFLPSVTGSMYGGFLGACAVLGYARSTVLVHHIISHLAKEIQKEDPKTPALYSYWLAIQKLSK